MATTHSNPFLVSSSFVVVALFLISSTFGFDTIEMGIPNCPSFSCGGINISYPFWVAQSAVGKSGTYCGYQELQINCTGSTPYFQTSSSRYVVKAFDTGAKTVTLADADADAMGSDCPRVKHNVNISQAQILNYAPTVTNLTFFFNCIPLDLKNAQNVSCLQNQAGLSYVLSGPVPPSDFVELNRSCKGGVVVSPVLSSGLEGGNNLPAVFTKALNAGFQLGWGDPQRSDCLACEDSKGRCGFSNSTTGKGLDFVCFCKAGRRSATCWEAKKLSTGTKLGIGVAAASFILGLVVLAAIFFWRRRRSRKRSTSAFLSYGSSLFSDRSSSLGKATESFINNLHTHIFTYEELEKATNGFDTKKELGDGGFGTVYKGKLKDGRVVAVKRLYENNFKRLQQFKNEIAILSRVRHQNLVTLYGCTAGNSKELLLVYEYVSNGTVADHLHGCRSDGCHFTWPIRMNIAIETAGALTYLHAVEPPIIHRDVKTHNILLDDSFHVKVADFGLSRLFPVAATHVSTAPQGTPGYLDPEYHHCYQLTDKSDVYSFGVVLVELISSKPAVDITRHRNEINLHNMFVNMISNGLLHEIVDPALGYATDPEVKRMMDLVAELAFRCLQQDKDMRPPMEEVWRQLVSIAGGDCYSEQSTDACKKVRDDTSLLSDSSMPFSPNTVTTQWMSSTSTTPNASK